MPLKFSEFLSRMQPKGENKFPSSMMLNQDIRSDPCKEKVWLIACVTQKLETSVNGFGSNYWTFRPFSSATISSDAWVQVTRNWKCFWMMSATYLRGDSILIRAIELCVNSLFNDNKRRWYENHFQLWTLWELIVTNEFRVSQTCGAATNLSDEPMTQKCF